MTGAIAASAALGIGVFASTANATSNPPGGQAAHVYCDVTIAPVHPGQSASRVLSRTCHEGTASRAIPPGASAAASYPIITIYQNKNYSGEYVTWYGTKPCSSNQSYTIADASPVNLGYGSWGASSWQAHSSCWHTTLYYGYSLDGPSWTYAQGVWEAGQIGSGFNDHVWSIWTRYQ